MITGICRSAPSPLRRSNTWKPSSSGIITSSSTRSNGWLRPSRAPAPVLRERGRIALALQPARQQVAVDLVVVDDQDLRSRFRPRGGSGRASAWDSVTKSWEAPDHPDSPFSPLPISLSAGIDLRRRSSRRSSSGRLVDHRGQPGGSVGDLLPVREALRGGHRAAASWWRAAQRSEEALGERPEARFHLAADRAAGRVRRFPAGN